MKLYATTTSERASKGQGGNDYLDILVNDEEKNLFRFYLEVREDEIYTELLDYSNGDKKIFSNELPTKSKKQKTNL